jgi:L-alanine-DL-glutamate epimerase-like enolase superfamily enzyme
VRAASLQLSATIPPGVFLTYEYYRIPERPNPLANDIVKRPIERFKDGFMELPDRPGLGIELKEELVGKYLVK